MKNNILIIGSGAFGTALSQPLLDNQNNVYFYCKNPEVATRLKNGEHPAFPGVILNKPTNCFTSLKDCFQFEIHYIVIAIPSNSLPEIYDQIKPFLRANMIVINTSKGLRDESDGVWSNLFLKDHLIRDYALIVGPSFADELVLKAKTIINVVAKQKAIAEEIQKIFNNDYFKLIYFGDEYIASLASSFKNSLALALGLLNHYTNHINTQSAYLTIGLQEIQEIMNALTGNQSVRLIDFFGVGDIFLTCTSDLSRNFRFGKSIGEIGFEKTLEQNTGKTIEGLRTLKIIHDYAEKYCLDLPLFEKLYAICYKKADPNHFLDDVWSAMKIN